MRLIPPFMRDLLGGGITRKVGPFIGDVRASGRVTVEKNWFLNTEFNVFTTDGGKLPFRWWQDVNNAQVETEVPNVRSISWDRGIDSDAASCTITLYNTRDMASVTGARSRPGMPGYLGWRERDRSLAVRWSDIPTDWANVLIPNALLRTYEGFGGHDKTIAQAVTDGNLLITGVWLIDAVSLDTTGQIKIQCRDMCKLLIEQQMYLPLMPTAKYPLAYQRWRYESFFYPAVNVYDRVDPSYGTVTYGPGPEGRKYISEIAYDADTQGYGMVGTDGGVFCYNTTFFGSRGAGAVGTVAGMAATSDGGGLWVINVGGEVFTVGNAQNVGRVEDWPVLADVTSIVAIEPTHTDNGYWILTETGYVFAKGDANATLGGNPATAVYIADMARTPNSAGYWLLGEDGSVYSYGNATYHGNATLTPNASATGIVGTSSGHGYWIVSDNGGVYSMGDAAYHGSFLGQQAAAAVGATGTVVDAARTSDGGGYWMVNHLGHVYSFGNAPYGGNATIAAGQTATGIAGRPQNDGYWVCASDGAVYSLGSAPYFGGANGQPLNAPVIAMASTSTGNGYWLFGADGGVFNYGDAAFRGAPTGSVVGVAAEADGRGTDGYWIVGSAGHVYSYGAPYGGGATIPAGGRAVGIAGRPQADGYWIAGADGAVYSFGNARYYGGASRLNRPISAIVSTPSGLGYWLIGEDGGVFAFGDAAFHGSGVGINLALNKPIIDIVATPTNGGYWLIAGDGGVFSYGDAAYFGSMAASPYTARAMARTPDGGGYWLVTDGGAIEHFGNAVDVGDAVGGVDQAPMRGFDMDPLGRGYWLAGEDGSVFTFGEAQFYGRPTGLSSPVIRLTAHPTGRGYWLLSRDGGVFAHGAAPFFGSGVGTIASPAVDMASTVSGNGYWILTEGGQIYSFGDAVYMLGATIAAGDKASALAARKQGDGYWIATEKGAVTARGAARTGTFNGDYAAALAALNDPIIGMDANNDGDGYILVAGDGGVFTFGTASFEGSLPADFSGTKRYDGNYYDFTDIIKDLLLWSGWLLHGTNDIFGNLETTGTFANDAFPPDTFDKKPVIDGIKAIKDIVGYHFWIDEEGGARFESPNWYVYGNFLQETGQRTGEIPEIDERLLLTSYGLSYVDKPVRSEIIITSDDPTLAAETTITTRLRPSNDLITQLLRGMVRPAMLPTPLNVTKKQQEDMAVLIEVFMAFQLLQGQVTCIAHPAIQVNDQVRVYEEVTGETDVHYVRNISSQHDLDTGSWTYSLTTNRVGPGRTALITGGGTNRAREIHRTT